MFSRMTLELNVGVKFLAIENNLVWKHARIYYSKHGVRVPLTNIDAPLQEDVLNVDLSFFMPFRSNHTL